LPAELNFSRIVGKMRGQEASEVGDQDSEVRGSRNAFRSALSQGTALGVPEKYASGESRQGTEDNYSGPEVVAAVEEHPAL
jgi:hypothetical protein